MKHKPAGLPLFAIGVDVGGRPEMLVFDGGELDGMMISFQSRDEAEAFIRENDAADHLFVVDLTDAGIH